MRLDLQLIRDSLEQEKSWKPGDSKSFFFENWNLSLRREELQYMPFTFSVFGRKLHSNETISRRYTSMEKAFLHILNRFNENANIENKFKSLSDIIEKFPDQHGLCLVDTYNIENRDALYSISLEPGFVVDVKVCPENGLIYVMQNSDGSTVHKEDTYEITFPDYSFNEESVLRFVKAEHDRRNMQSKVSLFDQIKSASTRITEAPPAGQKPIKMPSIDH